VSDDRTAGEQLRDLGGLFTGRNKIEGGRIVPKNPPPPPAPSPEERDDLRVDVDVDVDSR
jgi:hypothetical protein